MDKAYSYRRFSSAEQKKGRSADRQMQGCVKWCADNGVELATGKEHTFLDEGKSAFKGQQLDEENGQLARFIRLVDNKSIPAGSYLVVESLDRLGRDQVPAALTRFMKLLSKGINIVTLTDNRVYRKGVTEMELLMSIMVMSRAHEESSTKASRVGDAYRKKRLNARENKTPMGRAAPMWLRVIDGKYVEDEASVAIVKRIYEMCIAGYGTDATAKALNADDVESFKATRYQHYEGVAWGGSSVAKVLRNRAVLGEYQPYITHGVEKREKSGEPIQGYYPAIIPEDLFYQAQAAIAGRMVARATKQSKNFNVWQGIAKCAVCSSAMHLVNKGKPPKGSTYLHCSLARKGLCKSKAVRLDKAEAVFRQMLARLDSVALVQDNAGKITAQLEELAGRLVEKNERYNEMRAALKRRTTDALNDAIFEIETELKVLQGEEKRLKQALASERVGSLAEFLQRVDLTSYEGRSRANTLCKRLEVVVYMGTGWFVTEHGKWILTFVHKDGDVGSMTMEGDGTYEAGEGDKLVEQIYGLMAEGWATST